MVEHTAWRSFDGLSIELDDGRRIFVDDVLAEARTARALELRRLVLRAASWLGRLFTPLRASPMDRACELPGNRAALTMAMECRSEAALGHFAGDPEQDPVADASPTRADPSRIAA